MDSSIKDRMLDRLRFTDLEQEPFLVCFSGTPVSGKSTVAKVLEHRYKMVRIENDVIRGIISDEETDEDAYTVLKQFLKEYECSNMRIVLDSSIDRDYEEVRSVCSERDIPIFTVALQIPEDFDDKTRSRNGEEWNKWISTPKEKFVRDTKSAREDLEIDFMMEEDGGVKELLEVLDERLEKE